MKNSSKNRESQSFEEAFDRLKEIVSLIENPDNNLESMIELVEEGVALSRICEEKLNSFWYFILGSQFCELKLKDVQDRINIISKNSSDCD